MSDGGLKSKTFILTASSLIVPFTVATVALWLGKADFAGWASFTQYLIPLVSAPYLGKRAVDKLAARKQ